jgi:hypothetical protein
MAAPVVQKDSLTNHQKVLHKYMQIASPINGMFSGNEINPGDFENSRVVAVPDIRVDDYIVDADIARIGLNHYEGSEFTQKWKNGIPPIEWRYYSMSRHRSFGYTVFEEQEKYSPIKNLPQEYLARKMSTTVLRDHDKYLLLAIVLGRMTGKLIARTSADQFTSVIENTTGISAAEVACTGNQADYKWIAQPGEILDNEISPTFATIKGMVLDSVDPMSTLDALTLMFTENWFDTNFANSDRFLLITSALELSFRDALISKGAYVESGFDIYRNADVSGANGPSFLGTLRGSWKLMKIHPEFMPKVFVDSSNVVDPNPTLTGVGTATNRTLKQVVALAAYKGSAQTYDFYEDKREQEGGVRGKFTEYVQEFSYDAWVIDQKSEGIVPIFLPTDLDGNGTTDMDYNPVNDSFNRVAAALTTARSQLGTAGSFYPASGPNVKLSRPEWFNQEQAYQDTDNLGQGTNPLTGQPYLQETGDIAHTYPTRPGDNPLDSEELRGVIESVVDGTTARANTTAYTQGQKVRFSNGQLYEADQAGTSAGAQPSTTGVAIGETVTDGTVTWRRLV